MLGVPLESAIDLVLSWRGIGSASFRLTMLVEHAWTLQPTLLNGYLVSQWLLIVGYFGVERPIILGYLAFPISLKTCDDSKWWLVLQQK